MNIINKLGPNNLRNNIGYISLVKPKNRASIAMPQNVVAEVTEEDEGE